MIHTLNVDIETFSSIDIMKSGAYKYVEAPDFQILLFGYSVNGEPTIVIDLAQGEVLPDEIVRALKDPFVLKKAWNATFEILCISKYYETPAAHWQCTMINSMYLGLPASLGSAAKAIGLPQDKQKDTVGRALIRYFCSPVKATKKNGERERNLPHHDTEKWSDFVEYCRQDVEVEKEIAIRFTNFPVPHDVQKSWQLDFKINSRGVRIEKQQVDGAIHVDDLSKSLLTIEASTLTGVSNPNSDAQLMKWMNTFSEDLGVTVTSLKKESRAELIELLKPMLPADHIFFRVMGIKDELSKASVSKYKAMDAAVCKDDRIRGLLQFYGASRTGRWAGRLVQMQNLTKNHQKTIDLARELTQQKNYNLLKFTYGKIANILSELVRTTFIPARGNILVVSDFSAIEARVIAWLAGEQWRLEVFKTHGMIYEASASQMFGVPLDDIKKGGPREDLRQKGKVSELALGYQGGPGALEAMGALDMGLTKEELPDIVSRWRKANKRITDLWYSLDRASLNTMQTGHPSATHGILFERKFDISNGLDFLTAKLPSGRELFYAFPKLAKNRFDKEAITYMGIGENKQWSKLDTYGGKLTENIVQAIARDCLDVTMHRLHEAGRNIVMHVHDEVIMDEPESTADLAAVEALMAQPIPWAEGLNLSAEGFTSYYYKKD